MATRSRGTNRLVNGEIIWAPAIEGAFVLSTRGGDFALHLGQDVSIGYLSHNDTSVELYLQETLTFVVNTSEAAVALAPAGAPDSARRRVHRAGGAPAGRGRPGRRRWPVILGRSASWQECHC